MHFETDKKTAPADMTRRNFLNRIIAVTGLAVALVRDEHLGALVGERVVELASQQHAPVVGPEPE